MWREATSPWKEKEEAQKEEVKEMTYAGADALVDKGSEAHMVQHSLGQPVRKNRQVSCGGCVQGCNVTSPERFRACPSRTNSCVVSIQLTDQLVARRYISKLDEVTQLMGRKLVH